MDFAFLDSAQLRRRFESMRERTRELFSLLAPEAFDERPIPLRHPLRFYEGHLAAFNANVLWQAGFLDRRPNPAFGDLFARGIDPADEAEAAELRIDHWPPRPLVGEYVDEVDALMAQAIESGHLYDKVLTCIEHEEMHQETMVYLFHQLDYRFKLKPDAARLDVREFSHQAELREVPAGMVMLGAESVQVPFAWDNELPRIEVPVRAFSLLTHKVTNGDFLSFVEAGGYTEPEWWSPPAWMELQARGVAHPPFWVRREGEWHYRGLFEEVPLPPSLPVYVSHAEAEAYARWRGMRLPTEAEFQLAAYGAGEGREAPYDVADFSTWEQKPVGRPDEPVNDWGHAELVGNGWEWTSSAFEGFPGFSPYDHYPGYSADFFDGRHYVIKGGSPVTVAPLLRRSFRNWFRDTYRYAYTTFRCAVDR